MNNHPEQYTANSLAQYGRYGDSHLLHVSGDELRGIAALTGQDFTTNPTTGLPEAFSFAKFMQVAVPIAAGVVAPMAMPGISAAMAGGIGSGLATTAMTGDIERGLASGIMGAGLGAASGAAGSAAEKAAAEAAKSGLVDTTIAGGVAGLGEATATSAIQQELGVSAVTAAEKQAAAELLKKQTLEAAAQSGRFSLPGAPGVGLDQSIGAPWQNGLGQSATPAVAPTTFGQRAMAPFQQPGAFTGQLMKPTSALPIAIGMGQLAQMDQQDKWDKEAEELAGNRKMKLKSSYDDLQRGYMAAQPNAMRGTSPARSYMSWNTPKPMGYAGGGQTSFSSTRNYYDPQDYMGRGGELGEFAGFGAYGRRVNNGYGGIDPVEIQKNLRGIHSVAPPNGFIPGFAPEFRYFTNEDPSTLPQTPITGPQDWSAMYAGMPSSNVDLSGSKPYFSTIIPPEEEEEDVKGMAGGGEVTMNTALGPEQIAGGGIAGIPTEFTQPQQSQEPTPEDVQMLAAALTGQIEQPDQVIEMFVQKYGPEVFQILRDMILKSVGGQNAQTEGMISGEGTGMADQVPGTIGGQQPVAVSSGEYIVPADVVSGIGDGSSESGAQELDMMSNNVRQARQGGLMTQPPPINARRMMPR